MNESRPSRFTAAPPRLSIVVPLYNEEECIDEMHRRVTEACRCLGITSREIVLVNDGSKDGTLAKAMRLAAQDPQVVVIDLARNYGHQVALSAGLEFCRGERIFVIDADLQDPPELLGPMMLKMDEGHDVVYGVRASRAGEGWFKLASARAFHRLLSRLSDTRIPENAGDFRLMSRRALDALNAMPERLRFIRGMVSWIGFRQAPFPYERDARFAGTTHYPLRKMLWPAIDAITSFSVTPLRLASSLGVALGFLGLLMILYTIHARATGGVVQGWTSLASLVLVIGSVQMLILGIFGEYLGRVFIEVKNRPRYIVNEVIRGAELTPGVSRPEQRHA